MYDFILITYPSEVLSSETKQELLHVHLQKDCLWIFLYSFLKYVYTHTVMKLAGVSFVILGLGDIVFFSSSTIYRQTYIAIFDSIVIIIFNSRMIALQTSQ